MGFHTRTDSVEEILISPRKGEAAPDWARVFPLVDTAHAAAWNVQPAVGWIRSFTSCFWLQPLVSTASWKSRKSTTTGSTVCPAQCPTRQLDVLVVVQAQVKSKFTSSFVSCNSVPLLLTEACLPGNSVPPSPASPGLFPAFFPLFSLDLHFGPSVFGATVLWLVTCRFPWQETAFQSVQGRGLVGKNLNQGLA